MFRFFQQHSQKGILFLRLGKALVFVYHGYMKLWAPGGTGRAMDAFAAWGIPLPQISVYLSGGAEFFGGVMIGLGLLTRQASLFLIIDMLVAIFVAHRNDPYGQTEHAIQMLVLSIGTLFSGSGPWSLESLVKKHGD